VNQIQEVEKVEETKQEDDESSEEEVDGEGEGDSSDEEMNPKDFWYKGWLPNPAEEY